MGRSTPSKHHKHTAGHTTDKLARPRGKAREASPAANAAELRANNGREQHAPAEQTLDLFAHPTDALAGPAFARHETFAPRSGWLRKGFVRAAGEPEFFLADDSHLRLGVGKNMARAIRYWCHATGLLEDAPIAGGRAFASRPTTLGLRLLGAGGWDPYLEDSATLWLLHWELVKTPVLATAWYYAFTVFSEPEFNVDTLATALAQYTLEVYPRAGTAESSLKKDASCIARMYGEAPSGAVTEETIQSPFADLGLLRQGTERSKQGPVYHFEVGRKPGLDVSVVLAACLDFAARVSPGTQTLALSRLLVEPGSPGMAFKLGESSLVSYLEEAAQRYPGFAFADAGGLIQIAFEGRPQAFANRVLSDYYRHNASTVAA